MPRGISPDAAKAVLRLMLAFAAAIPLSQAAPAGVGAHSLDPIRPEQWTRDAAAHLLRRAGFGGTPAQIDALHAMGLDAAVEHLVEYTRIPYDNPPPAAPRELLERPDRAARRAMTEEQRRAADQRRRRLERRHFEEVRLWWIDRMLNSPRPFEERMTLFWHGLLTSGMREVRNPVFMAEQNEFLRRNALGTFRDLLVGISRDRAMLVYLDGNRNRKEQPNENYARELFELFALGEGNYTERDVREAARAFTGWGFDESGFVFRIRSHDAGPKRVLGRSGRLDGTDVIDAILEHPASSRHLSRKLLSGFCREQPERQLVEALAATIRRERFRLRPVMTTLLKSQAFHHEKSRATLVKSPVDIVVGTARTLGVSVEDPLAAQQAMSAMGQTLMQPPSVKGWDGGLAWINAATLFNRYNVVGRLIHGDESDRASSGRLARRAARGAVDESNDEAVEPTVSRGSGDSGMMGARTRRSGQPAFDAAEWVELYALRDAEQIVDFLLEHLLAAPFPPEKRDLLVAYLEDGRAGARLDRERAASRIRTLVHLICSTPEFQLY